MKYLIMILVMVASFGAQAEIEVSANGQLSTEYIFRGQNQTSGEPAVSGGFDVGYGETFAGVWASKVDYGDDLANVEVDLYAGYGYEWKDFSASYTYMDYNYAGDSSLNGVEHQIALGWKDVGLLHVVGAEGFVDYSEVSYTLPMVKVDVSWGTWDTIGDNWSIGKTIKLLEGLDGTLQYIEFHGDAGIPNQKNIVFTLSKEI